MYSGAPDTNYGLSGYIGVGCWVSNKLHRGLIHFTLPAGSGTITKVELYLHTTDNDLNLTSHNIEVHQLTQTNWVENQFTWNSYSTGNSWASPGGDYSATVIDVIAVNAKLTWFSWILMGEGAENPLTLDWEDEVHLLLRNTNESSWQYAKQFDDKTVSGYEPYLKITYITPAGKVQTMII